MMYRIIQTKTLLAFTIAMALGPVASAWAQPAAAAPPAPQATPADPDSADDAAAGRPTQGRVVNLPSSELDPIVGHYHLFRVSHKEAIDRLGNGDLKGFVESYRQITQSAVEISDGIAEGKEKLGEAIARFEIMNHEIDKLSQQDSTPTPDQTQLREDLKTFRNMLGSRLGALKERYLALKSEDAPEPADGEAESEEEKKMREANAKKQQDLRRQMAAIVGRIEEIDDTSQSLTKNTMNGLSATAANGIQQQLRDLKTTLDEESASLEITAAAMRVQISESAKELQRSFDLIRLQASLPHKQMQRLRQLQASANAVLQKLISEKRIGRDRVLAILSSGQDPNAPVPDEADLLKRVDELIEN